MPLRGRRERSEQKRFSTQYPTSEERSSRLGRVSVRSLLVTSVGVKPANLFLSRKNLATSAGDGKPIERHFECGAWGIALNNVNPRGKDEPTRKRPRLSWNGRRKAHGPLDVLIGHNVVSASEREKPRPSDSSPADIYRAKPGTARDENVSGSREASGHRSSSQTIGQISSLRTDWIRA